jgi:hypothetical protein
MSTKYIVNNVEGQTIGDWGFGATGLTFPDDTVQTTAYPGTPDSISSGPFAPGSAVVANPTDVDINFSDGIGTAWSFDPTGLTFPDDTRQTTAYTGGVTGPTGPAGETGPAGPTGSGGGSSYVEDTYANLETLRSSNGLVPGTLYKITDRSNNLGIFIKAVTTDRFSTDAFRFMYVPKTYDWINDGTYEWIHIWSPTLEANAGDLCIWGARVWENVAGNSGAAVDSITLDNEWTELPFNTPDVYVIKGFDCTYNFNDDWVESQTDGSNQIGGINESDWNSNYPHSWNPCDRTDWNYATSGSKFYGNRALYILNNSAVGNIFENIGIAIYNNYNLGSLVRNRIDRIYNNTTNGFDIRDNIGISLYDNVTGNIPSGSHIYFNNVMFIYGNSIETGIGNNIGYTISTNTALQIFGNTVNGISNNTIAGGINENMNNGSISSNTNTGSISGNNNNGYILNNSNAGNITGNSNNGYISGITGTTTNIQYNTNNGNIVTTVVGPISDAIVNK